MTGTIIAGVLQLIVPSYAYRLVRRFGTQNVGWFIVTAFVSLGLLHLVGPPKAMAGAGTGIVSDLIYAAGAVLLLIGMGHMESICSQRERARSHEEAMRSKCEFEARQEIKKLARANEELAAEMARRESKTRTLLELEALYRFLFTESPQPMFLFDLNCGRFLAVNQAALRQYGYTEEEFQALKAQDLLPADAVASFLQELGLPCPGMQTRGFWQHCRKDRSQIEVELTAVDLTYGDGPARLFIATDIGQRRRRERETQRTQKLEGIAQVTKGVAHHFNNILTIIQGYASIAESDPQNPKNSEHMKQISAAVVRATGLTRQLQAASGRQSAHVDALDLNALLRNHNQTVRRLLGEKIVLQANYGLVEVPVLGDPQLIEQMVTNLALNARDAMSPGGTLTISTAMTRASHPNPDHESSPGGYVRLTVRDDGCGMPPDVQARLFEPFFTTKDIGKGAGLGLAGVYGAVQRQAGWIEFNSEVGAGTEFRVFLPCASREAAQRRAATQTNRSPARPTVLLVEPDDRARQLARCTLDWHGYQVIEADCSSVAALLWEGQAARVDLLMTNAVFPDGALGCDLAKQLRQGKPTLKVLYSLSNSPEAESNAPASFEGQRVIAKPYTPEQLLKEVHHCLARVS